MGNICSLGYYQNLELSEKNILRSIQKEFSVHNNRFGIFEVNIGNSDNIPITEHTMVYVVGESGKLLCCMQYEQFIAYLLSIISSSEKQYKIEYIDVVNSVHCSHYKWYTLLSPNKHICVTIVD